MKTASPAPAALPKARRRPSPRSAPAAAVEVSARRPTPARTPSPTPARTPSPTPARAPSPTPAPKPESSPRRPAPPRLAREELEAVGALAHDYLASGAFEHAVALYRGLAALEPRSADHWIGLGVSLDETGSFAEAERALLRARKIAPHDPRILMKLGEIRLARGDAARARALLRRATEAKLEPVELRAKAEALLEILERTHQRPARAVKGASS